MAEEKKEKKKIIVDEDWKTEVEKDREKEKVESEKEKEEEKKRPPLPEGDFAALISMLVTQAYFAMGAIAVEGQEPKADLEMARYNIDMLNTLEEKTKGNLTDEEAKVLSETLNQVRMVFVQVSGKSGQ